MISVIVETNFLLTLSLKQEEYVYAYKILKLGKNKKINLCIPSFCIFEAYQSFFKKRQQQELTKTRIKDLMNDASRNSRSKKSFLKYGKLEIDIAQKLDQELKMIDKNVGRVISIAYPIEHNSEIHQRAIRYRSKLNLKDEPDAFIVSAVDWYKRVNNEKELFFVTEDRKSLTSKTEVVQWAKTNNIILHNSYKNCIRELKNRRID